MLSVPNEIWFGRLAGLVWLSVFVVLAAMLALVVPSILTLVAAVSIVLGAFLLLRPSNPLALQISVAASVVLAAVGLLYRAGPTSGFQTVNAVVVGLAVGSILLSVQGLRRREVASKG